MSNDIVNLINQLISETITLKNEIKKLNTRLNNKVVKQMIQDDIIDNSLLFNTNSYNNPKKRYRQTSKIKDGQIVIDFD
tara:strand:- start:232 stop:468 length:237 start_codon:yes stop_codon:yes gene_type:complete